MKYTTRTILAIAIVLVTACNFNVSMSKDFMTGITTSGNGISVDEVYLSDGTSGLKRRTFTYGEKIFTNFSDISGFTIEDGLYYPVMNVLVISKEGDTIMNYPDLYGGKAIDASENTLNGHVILADPIKSNEEYTILYSLIDGKGDGSFTSKMDFKVAPDQSIKVAKSGFDFAEVYIMNNDEGTVITDNTIDFNQNIYLNFQGLTGYTVDGNTAEVGLSVKLTDDSGNVLIEEADIFKGQKVAIQNLKQGIASTIILSPGSVDNPLKWEVDIWDKNSDAKLSAQTQITINE
ncbi:hypothetical protein N9954_03035 [Maribacter sp.]|nr:hypothetical protein [Maribacter sp.]